MKEKINLLSRGIFEYDKPDIVVSEEIVVIEAEAGTLYHGYFDVSSINGLPVRAMVFSSNKLVVCQENMIVGENCRVNFTFDPAVLAPDETIDGHFSIISNGGELEIPFTAHVCVPFCSTSEGDIKDLYQFTDLARSNWHEAVKLFRSPDFARVFLNHKKNRALYDNLIKSRNANQALEEFLCTIKRKSPVHVRVVQDELCFENIEDTISEHLVLEKDAWGYQKISVAAEGEFLKVYKKELTTEDFLGSYYEPEYMIYPQKFLTGNNYGKIILTTFDKVVEIPVVCKKTNRIGYDDTRRSLKSSLDEIFRNYLKLSMGRMSKIEWVRRTREAVDCCRNNSNDAIYEVMEAHFCILAGEERNAQELLKNINGWELRHRSVVYHAYYLYIQFLLASDHLQKMNLEKIQTDYDHQYDYWQLLWFILNMNDRLSVQKRFALVKEQFEKGCRSPLLYWEAVKAVNEDPSLLRELDRFEILLVAWASRYDCLSNRVVYQFAQVCTYSRHFDPLVLRTLLGLCEVYESREILNAVCSMLIKGQKTEHKYHRWYALGIESSLKLTELYEYYMYSLDESETDHLPVSVLLYFNYDNHLSVDKKSFIYTYVIEHREEIPRIYHDYENIMKAFTYDQLKHGFINRNMVKLYKHFISVDKINTGMAGFLPQVLFKYQICCSHPKICGVIVSHREVEKETYYPLEHGTAFVDIYMDEYQLVFVDRDDYRYVGSVSYTMERLMDDPELLKECCRLEPDIPMILLNRSERAMKYHKIDDTSIDIYKRTLKLKNISRQYQKNVLKNLIDFYYDNYEGETLEKYLLRLDIALMDAAERARIIEYYIQRGLYEKARDAIRIYGYEGIQDKKLMRLCSKLIRANQFEKDDLVTEMAYLAFSCGKYDDVILEYLIQNYLGTTKDLYGIWRAARDFEVNAFVLEEKLLCQILFTESFIQNGLQIFKCYYKARPKERIVRAFLAFYCYLYLVKDCAIDTDLFGFVEIELEQLDQVKDVCALALLKYYAFSKTALTGHEAWCHQMVSGFMERGMILPFFKAFVTTANLPEELLDKVYVSYCTNPKNTVTICYECHSVGEPEGEYIIEDMPNIFGGIFVKAFRIFANEEIKYHITEKNAYAETITDAQTLHGTADVHETPKNGIEWVNQLLMLSDGGDREILEEKLEQFEVQRYMSKKLFTLIQER